MLTRKTLNQGRGSLEKRTCTNYAIIMTSEFKLKSYLLQTLLHFIANDEFLMIEGVELDRRMNVRKM